MDKVVIGTINLPRNFNDVRDNDIFEALDPKFPGLEKVVEKYRAGDMAAAKRELVLYFKKRQCLKWGFDFRNTGDNFEAVPNPENKKLITLPPYLDGYSDKDVEKFLKKDYRDNSECDEDLFPVYDATSEVDNKPPRVKANNFVRMNFINCMINGFYSTGDRIYATKLKEFFEVFFERFLEKYPYKFDDVPEIEYSFFFQKNPMRTIMSVGHSVLRLTNLLYTPIPYMNEFPQEITFKIIKFIWYIVMYHKLFEKNKYRYYNHHLFERGIMPFTLSVAFPEFPVIRNMRQRAIEVIHEHIEKDFNQDSGYDEHSISYYVNTTLKEFIITVHKFALENGIILFGQEQLKKLNETFDLLSTIIMPDTKLPDIGDNGGANGIITLSYGRDLFKNKKCDAVLRALDMSLGEEEKNKLPPLCGNYPYSGYFVARDKWSPQANYFLMSNKIFTRTCAHNHLDMLSLIMAVRGETIIGEPLARLYKSVSNGSALDDYIRGTGAHNTVFIHGQPLTKKYLENNGVTEKQTVHTSFVQEKTGKVFVSAFHEAYPNCRHTREVLFKYGKGWIVKDTVKADTQKNTPHIQRWHFEVGVKINEVTSNSVLITRNKAKLLCIWPDREDIKLKFWKHEEVLSIERGNHFPDMDSLPYILDVSFGSSSDAIYAKLACLLLDVTDGFEVPDISSCNDILEDVIRNGLSIEVDF